MNINVGGSPEAPHYVENLINEKGATMVGVTETHNAMARKIRCDFPQIGAPRPPSSVDEKAHAGVALLKRKEVNKGCNTSMRKIPFK